MDPKSCILFGTIFKAPSPDKGSRQPLDRMGRLALGGNERHAKGHSAGS
jgi:hypothetical protein